jgi:hypothetical protein
VCVRPEREERELLRLLRGGLGDAGAAVAGVDDEQAGEPVDVALAARVPDVVALALDDDGHAGALGHHRLACEVHPEVVAGLGLQVGVVDGHRVPQL